MIVIPQGDQKEFAQRWLESQIGAGFGPAEIIMVSDGEKPQAVVMYHNYRGEGIEVSMAAVTPKWAKRDDIRACLAYPFHQLQVRRVTALVDKRNRRARRFLEGIGFILEGSLKDALPDGDMCLYGMTRRWFLRSKWNEQEKSQSAGTA